MVNPSEESLFDQGILVNDESPKLYKVIEMTEDDIDMEIEEGWQRLQADSPLLLDEEFLDLLNCSIESIENEESAIVTSKLDSRG